MEISKEVCRAAAGLAAALRRKLHEMPEASGQERRTKACLMEFMREHTDFVLTDMGKWFYCVRREPKAKETIAFRADMDAVTGPDGAACHLCGHDGHSASLAGFGAALKGIRTGKNIVLIFQYGEETGEGGAVCSQVIEREGVDQIFAYHNCPGQELGTVVLREKTYAFASEGLILEWEGSPAHAAYPENGKNPAHAVCRLVEMLPELTDQKQYEDTVLCTVIHIGVGKPAFGMSASKGRLLLTIRGARSRDMEYLETGILEAGRRLAEGEGLDFSWKRSDVFPDTRNDSRALDRAEEVCRREGLPVIRPEAANRASEDFGWYLKKVSGAMLDIGSGKEHAALHTAGFEFPDELLETAIRLWLGIAVSSGTL